MTFPITYIKYSPGYFPVNTSGRFISKPIINYKGEICKNCNCANCSKRGLCFGLLGDAGGAIKLTVTPQNVGYATAWVNFKENLKIRTAGGTTIGDNDLIETVKQIGLMPYEVVKQALKFTNPGIIYEVYQAGKETATNIGNKIKNNPQFKQKVKNIVETVTTTAKDIVSTVTNPIVSTSKLITWLPYIVIGVLAVLAYGVVSGDVSTPKKVSVF